MRITDAAGVIGSIVMIVMVLIGWLATIREDCVSRLSRWKRHIAVLIAGLALLAIGIIACSIDFAQTQGLLLLPVLTFLLGMIAWGFRETWRNHQ